MSQLFTLRAILLPFYCPISPISRHLGVGWGLCDVATVAYQSPQTFSCKGCELICFINCEMLVEPEMLHLNWDFVEEVEVNRVEYKSALTEVPCLDS